MTDKAAGAQIRKLVVQIDETRTEMGRPVDPPTRRAVAMAVIANPYAGRYSENLDDLVAIGEELGGLLGERCVQALGIAPARRACPTRRVPARSWWRLRSPTAGGHCRGSAD